MTKVCWQIALKNWPNGLINGTHLNITKLNINNLSRGLNV